MRANNRKHLYHSLVFVVCAALSPGALAGAQPALHQRIAEIVEAEAKHDLFSGTVLVARNGRIIYARGVGEANKEYGIPNILETRFNISSVQKTFIATLTMQLVQEGRIGLDDPLSRFFPDCPYTGAAQIRVRHLLNHTGGLGDYRDSDEYRANADRYTCIEDVLPLVFSLEPEFTAGERFRYSNAGVLLLKAVIEKVTGLGLQQALQQRIFDPLGMVNSSMFRSGDLLPNRATAYEPAGDGDTYRRVTGEPAAYAGGGIYTTVLDLLTFDQALYGDKLLDAKHRAIMFTPVDESPDYACGWIVTRIADTTVIHHSGGSGGFNSEFRRYPEKGYTLVALSNYRRAASEVADKIDSLLLDLPYDLATETDRHFNRGMFLQDREAYVRAIEQFNRNIEGKDPHLPSMYQAARTRILGKFDQQRAVELLDRYIELAGEYTQPSAAAAWWRKGVAFEQLGKIEQATRCHRKCLELHPGFADAAEALARLQPPG